MMTVKYGGIPLKFQGGGQIPHLALQCPEDVKKFDRVVVRAIADRIQEQ